MSIPPEPDTVQATSAGDAAICIGRFQPLHLGHLGLIQQALAMAPRCVIVIGSAHQARTPKNPFTWQERADMIRLAVSASERERLLFLPMRDFYDEVRWAAAVHAGVSELLAQSGGVTELLAHPAGVPELRARSGGIAAPKVALVGHFKDVSSDYLHAFPDWALAPAARHLAVDATPIRDAYFGCQSGQLDATLAAMAMQIPASTLDFLRAWAAAPAFGAMVEEWRMLRAYRQMWATAPYSPVFVTADAVVRCAGHVLLVQRGQVPGKGLVAVPGGFIEQAETVYESALRELREETRIDLSDTILHAAFKSSAVFDHPDRSQRGRTISHAHLFDLRERRLPAVHAGDDAASVEWMPIDSLAAIEDRFFDDHFHILDHFLGLLPR